MYVAFDDLFKINRYGIFFFCVSSLMLSHDIFLDLFGLTAFWNVPQKLTFIIWFLTLIQKMYFLFSGFFFYKKLLRFEVISYVFVKKLEF